MPKFEAPEMGKWDMTCPFCATLARQHWRKVLVDDRPDPEPPSPVEHVKRNTCSACDVTSWWIDGVLVSPVIEGGPVAHDEMPADVLGLYNEARTVAKSSPRSAPALLRTALETLTSNHLTQPGRLNDAIGALVKAGKIDDELQQTMDYLRLSGNGAVHVTELQLDDGATDASALFELLNLCVEGMVARPRRIRALYDKIPESKRQQIERRDGAE